MPFLSNVQDVDSLEPAMTEAIDEKVMEAIQKASTSFLYEFIPDFDESEFKIINDNSYQAVQNYREQIYKTIGPINSCQDINNLKDDTKIVTDAIASKNFEQINCLSSSYLQGYKAIKELTLPLNCLEIHKKLLTILWTLSKSYEVLPSFEQDPLKGMIALEKFKEANETLFDFLEEMIILLESYSKNY